MRPKLAFLGTGLLGFEIARRFAISGFPLFVWNRTRAKAEPLKADGAVVTGSPAEAAAQAELVLLMLTDARAVHEVLFSEECRKELRGKTICQLGTISSAETKEIGEKAKQAGASYFEAPVLGSKSEAETGKLIVMVGGEEQQFKEWKETFSAVGEKVVYAGKLGQAASLKLALNQLIGSLTSSFSLSLGLVRQRGVDVDLFMDILRGSALYAPTFDKKLARMLSGDFRPVNFPVKHLLKDVKLILGEASACGLSTAALEGVKEQLEAALSLQLADEDYSAVFSAITSAGKAQN